MVPEVKVMASSFVKKIKMNRLDFSNGAFHFHNACLSTTRKHVRVEAFSECQMHTLGGKDQIAQLKGCPNSSVCAPGHFCM